MYVNASYNVSRMAKGLSFGRILYLYRIGLILYLYHIGLNLYLYHIGLILYLYPKLCMCMCGSRGGGTVGPDPP